MRSDDCVVDEDPVLCKINAWEDLLRLHMRNYATPPSDEVRWIFRGDKLRKFLRTKLEHDFELYDVPQSDKEKREIEIVREFQRKASLYLNPTRTIS